MVWFIRFLGKTQPNLCKMLCPRLGTSGFHGFHGFNSLDRMSKPQLRSFMCNLVHGGTIVLLRLRRLLVLVHRRGGHGRLFEDQARVWRLRRSCCAVPRSDVATPLFAKRGQRGRRRLRCCHCCRSRPSFLERLLRRPRYPEVLDLVYGCAPGGFRPCAATYCSLRMDLED